MAALADELAALAPDALVVAAYGRILPARLVAGGRIAINVHPSLLPRHRGAAPVAWTLLRGDGRTGVTLLGVGPEVDAAPMYDQVEVAVRPEDDRGALEGRLSQLAATRLCVLLDTLATRPDRTLPSVAQTGEATYAPKLGPEDEGIRWDRPAVDLVRQVRALAPRPGARTATPDGPLLVLWAQAEAAPPEAPVGEVRAGADGFPRVACADGQLRLVRVRPAGKATMDGDAWLRGRARLLGARLGGEGGA